MHECPQCGDACPCAAADDGDVQFCTHDCDGDWLESDYSAGAEWDSPPCIWCGDAECNGDCSEHPESE